MNDRQRIEAAIMPALIYAVVKNMDIYQKSEDEVYSHKFITDTAYNAYAVEPIAGLMPKHQAQIRRRLNRVYQEVAPILNEFSNGKCMMVIYYMFEELIQQERLSVYEGTDFAKAMELFMDSIQYLFDREKLDKSAQKQADKILGVIRHNGYFN